MELFYRLFAGFYDSLDITYFRNYEKSPRKALLDAISENDRVLDLCTGTAANAIRIASAKQGQQIVGVDLSAEMLNVAKGKIKRAGLKNIELLQMDATHLEFREHSFDKILLSLVLHEVDESVANQILAEAKRVLKPDGEILLTEWEPSSHFLQRLLFLPISLLEPKPYRSFIKKDLPSYFESLGLRVQSVKHCNYSQVFCLKK